MKKVRLFTNDHSIYTKYRSPRKNECSCSVILHSNQTDQKYIDQYGLSVDCIEHPTTIPEGRKSTSVYTGDLFLAFGLYHIERLGILETNEEFTHTTNADCVELYNAIRDLGHVVNFNTDISKLLGDFGYIYQQTKLVPDVCSPMAFSVAHTQNISEDLCKLTCTGIVLATLVGQKVEDAPSNTYVANLNKQDEQRILDEHPFVVALQLTFSTILPTTKQDTDPLDWPNIQLEEQYIVPVKCLNNWRSLLGAFCVFDDTPTKDIWEYFSKQLEPSAYRHNTNQTYNDVKNHVSHSITPETVIENGDTKYETHFSFNEHTVEYNEEDKVTSDNILAYSQFLHRKQLVSNKMTVNQYLSQLVEIPENRRNNAVLRSFFSWCYHNLPGVFDAIHKNTTDPKVIDELNKFYSNYETGVTIHKKEVTSFAFRHFKITDIRDLDEYCKTRLHKMLWYQVLYKALEYRGITLTGIEFPEIDMWAETEAEVGYGNQTSGYVYKKHNFPDAVFRLTCHQQDCQKIKTENKLHAFPLELIYMFDPKTVTI